MSEHCIIIVTFPNKEEAQKIAQVLLGKKVIACANSINVVDSFFWWKGTINHEAEVMLIAKTRTEHFHAVETLIKSRHSYEVPETIALPIMLGSQSYLDWIDGSVSRLIKE